MSDDIAHARDLIDGARQLLVLTGAGVSAESGVPTFRGEGGLWKSYRAEDLATSQAFARDPRLVWEWYAWRRELVRACQPNAAHVALAQASCTGERCRLVTQNVDGLHERAAHDAWVLSGGDPDARLPDGAIPLRLHGSLFAVKCSACEHRARDWGAVDASSAETLPRCPDCGSLLRPDVVWFGEPLDQRVMSSALAAAAACDVCLVVGTSGIVEPAASLPRAARAGGARILEVNPEPTRSSARVDVFLRAEAGRVLPTLFRDAP